MGYENSEKENILWAKVELLEDDFGKGLPEGTAGEKRNGFSFFELRKIKDGAGKVISETWEFITSQINESPILSAVTNEQYEKWKKAIIKAVPAEFIWDNDKQLWRIEMPNQ